MVILMKHLRLYGSVALVLIAGGTYWYFILNRPVLTAFDLALNGDYVLDTANPLLSSDVIISSSTPEHLTYDISTAALGHTGELGGTADRVVGTSTLAYLDKSNEGCVVTLVFPSLENVYYTTIDDAPAANSGEDYVPSCSDYHGAHGRFMNGSLHMKNGTVTLPTIRELGFTDEDIQMFEKLLPDSISRVQGFLQIDIDYGIDGASTTLPRLSNIDIPGAIGYAIQTPNVYNGMPGCDFSQGGGLCEYTAFMKDQSAHYWVMNGTNGNAFSYATNDPRWKSKLPLGFRAELQKMGISASSINFSK